MYISAFRLQLQELNVLLNRFLGVATSQADISQLQTRLCKRRFLFNGPLIGNHRLIQLITFFIQLSQIVIYFSV